jgi:hypothetical protein
MNMDDSQMIARLQSLTTGFMAAKRLGQWRPELADELYRIWLELEQRGLKNTPECRNAMWAYRCGDGTLGGLRLLLPSCEVSDASQRPGKLWWHCHWP